MLHSLMAGVTEKVKELSGHRDDSLRSFIRGIKKDRLHTASCFHLGASLLLQTQSALGLLLSPAHRHHFPFLHTTRRKWPTGGGGSERRSQEEQQEEEEEEGSAAPLCVPVESHLLPAACGSSREDQHIRSDFLSAPPFEGRRAAQRRSRWLILQISC